MCYNMAARHVSSYIAWYITAYSVIPISGADNTSPYSHEVVADTTFNYCTQHHFRHYCRTSHVLAADVDCIVVLTMLYNSKYCHVGQYHICYVISGSV